MIFSESVNAFIQKTTDFKQVQFYVIESFMEFLKLPLKIFRCPEEQNEMPSKRIIQNYYNKFIENQKKNYIIILFIKNCHSKAIVTSDNISKRCHPGQKG